jgi:hypothetical protein
MRVDDVADALKLALTASSSAEVHVRHGPRLLSDNGPSYIAVNLAERFDKQKIEHVRGAPCHPQTQGKIKHRHQTSKNRILLESYFLPGDLENQIDAFIAYYNRQRRHEKPEEPNACRHVLRQRADNSLAVRKNKMTNHPKSMLASQQKNRLNLTQQMS